MVTTIILPPAAALESATAELGQGADVKRLVTLNKGLYDLLTIEPSIIRVSGGYLIPSSSRGGLIHRLDDVQGCSCEAGRKGVACRHATSIEIIEAAQMRAIPALSDRISAARRAQAAQRADAASVELFG